jgi:hypothetical protein
MSDSWQTIPVKHRKWVTSSGASVNPDATTTAHPGSAFSTQTKRAATTDPRSSVSFSSFGSRKSKEESQNREMPSAFANKRDGRDSRREQDEQRRMWQARLEMETQRAQDEEEKTLREALTIESEKEYPSLSPICAKKSSSVLNFKAVVEASPVAQIVPNTPRPVTASGSGSGAGSMRRPMTPQYHYDEDTDVYADEDGRDAW